MNGARKGTPPNDAILNPPQVGRGDSAAAGRGARGGGIIFVFRLTVFSWPKKKETVPPVVAVSGGCAERPE
jgi:hypothetical protein